MRAVSRERVAKNDVAGVEGSFVSNDLAVGREIPEVRDRNTRIAEIVVGGANSAIAQHHHLSRPGDAFVPDLAIVRDEGHVDPLHQVVVDREVLAGLDPLHVAMRRDLLHAHAVHFEAHDLVDAVVGGVLDFATQELDLANHVGEIAIIEKERLIIAASRARAHRRLSGDAIGRMVETGPGYEGQSFDRLAVLRLDANQEGVVGNVELDLRARPFQEPDPLLPAGSLDLDEEADAFVAIGDLVHAQSARKVWFALGRLKADPVLEHDFGRRALRSRRERPHSQGLQLRGGRGNSTAGHHFPGFFGGERGAGIGRPKPGQQGAECEGCKDTLGSGQFGYHAGLRSVEMPGKQGVGIGERVYHPLAIRCNLA
jgi:hypothetical protein